MDNKSHNRLSSPTANGLYVNGNGATHSGLNGGSTTTAPSFPTRPPIPTQSGGDLTLKDLVELISQGLLIIRAKWYWGLLAATVLGGLVGYALLNRPVEHAAQTLILAQGTLDKIIGVQAEGGGDTQMRENSLRNHLSVMDSRKFRARLIQSFTQQEKQMIAEPYLVPGQSVTDEGLENLLAGKIGVERERGREFFTIQVTHRHEAVALMVADHFAAQYLNLVQGEFRDANKAGFELLEKQADALRNEIADIEEERLNFRKQHKIISRADNQGILAERLKRLDSSLTDTRVRRVQLETQVVQAKVDRKKSDPWDNAYLATYANNPLLRQELDRGLAQRSVLASRYGPNHPKLRDMDASIKGIRDNIQRNFDLAVLDLQNQYDMARQTETQLQSEFDEAFASSIEIEKLASRYEILGTDVDGKRQTLAQLQKKLGDASLSSQLPTDFMQIVDPAFIVKPRLPKKVIYIGFVAILAFGAFVATPLLVNLLDERIKGTTDVEAVLDTALLGAVPVLKGRLEDRAHIVRDRTDVAVAEVFVGVTAQLDISSQAQYPKVVLVTSTLPGEGKSTVVSNLAASYTQLGKKVVIVDLDLRRPTQHKLHGVPDKGGFLNWAKAGFPQFDVSQGHATLGLHVLPDGTHLIAAGGDEAQPSHYFVSKQLPRLLDELRGRYDVVLVDTPPAGLFQDALVLSRYAHERILVAREAKAPVAQVKAIIGDFNKAAAAFTGVVLNGFNLRTAHKKLAYGYHKGNYTYHEKSAKSAAKN